MIIPLPQSTLPKMLVSMECWEESSWMEEIQTKMWMDDQLLPFAVIFSLQDPLHLWMEILFNGRITLVELLARGQRDARILGIVGKAMLVRLEKWMCSVGPLCLAAWVSVPKVLLGNIWVETTILPGSHPKGKAIHQHVHTMFSGIWGIKS